MASTKEQIIRDIIKIFERYDAKDIATALDAIRTGEAFTNLLDAMEEVGSRQSEADKSHRPHPRAGRNLHNGVNSKEPLDHLIAELEQSKEPELQGLMTMLAAARRGEILRSSAAVRTMMMTLGVPIPATKDRLSLVRLVGEHLSRLRPDDLRTVLQEFQQPKRQDSTLEGWTNIIVRKDKA